MGSATIKDNILKLEAKTKGTLKDFRKIIESNLNGSIEFDKIEYHDIMKELGHGGGPVPVAEYQSQESIEDNDKKEIDEKHLLEKAVSYEFDNNLKEAEKYINNILSANPRSYHALFLKARIKRKKGDVDSETLKSAFEEAINQNAGKDIFGVILDEMKDSSIFKDYYLTRSWLNVMNKQKDRILEKALGFNHYIEMKDVSFEKDQNHDDTIKAFFEFVGKQKLKVVRTYDGEIEKSFNMDLEKIKENLILLEQRNGDFYDDDLCVSYSFLGDNFYACVHPSMLFFSANKNDVRKMVEILDKYDLKYHEPYELGER